MHFQYARNLLQHLHAQSTSTGGANSRNGQSGSEAIDRRYKKIQRIIGELATGLTAVFHNFFLNANKK